jgi:signal transduction histidine kinase
MNQYAISCLIASLACLFLGAFIYLKNIKRLLNVLWALFELSIAIWVFSQFVESTTSSKEVALFWNKILLCGVTFIPIFFLHFVTVFLSIRHRKIITASYLIGLSFLALNFTPFMIKGVTFKPSLGYYTSPGPAYYFLFLFFGLCVIFAFSLIAHHFKTLITIKQEQLKYITIGSMIGFTCGFGNFLPTFNLPVFPIINYIFILSQIPLMYAILEYRFMDISIVIKKTTVYSILVSLITILYFAIIYLTELLFRSFVGYKSILVALALVSLFTLIFQPLKDFIQSFVDKYFFKDSQAVLAEKLKKAQEDLKRADRLKAVGTLAAGMAHEIKNPLTGIMTFTDYLPAKHTDSAFIEKFHKIVSTEVNKINSIVQQLLDFSKPKPLKLQETNIHNIIDQMLSLLNNDIIKRKINLVRNYDKALPLLRLDPNQIQQVFCNLFLNAIDALKEGGEIVITTKKLSGDVEIIISDTGQGIPKKDLEHIFDPFYTTKETGTGLGMSIVYGIIKEHKGTIDVESKINKGTTFKIRFPYFLI